LKKAIRNNDKNAVTRLQSKIKEIEEEMNSTIPNEDNIKDMLMGLGGDASSFSYMLEDSILQNLHNYYMFITKNNTCKTIILDKNYKKNVTDV
jgi:hypothetical protein